MFEIHVIDTFSFLVCCQRWFTFNDFPHEFIKSLSTSTKIQDTVQYGVYDPYIRSIQPLPPLINPKWRNFGPLWHYLDLSNTILVYVVCVVQHPLLTTPGSWTFAPQNAITRRCYTPFSTHHLVRHISDQQSNVHTATQFYVRNKRQIFTLLEKPYSLARQRKLLCVSTILGTVLCLDIYGV